MPAVDFYYVSMCSVEKFISGHNTHEQGQSPEYVATIAPTKLVKGGKISTTIIFSQNKKKGVCGGGGMRFPSPYIHPSAPSGEEKGVANNSFGEEW